MLIKTFDNSNILRHFVHFVEGKVISVIGGIFFPGNCWISLTLQMFELGGVELSGLKFKEFKYIYIVFIQINQNFINVKY